MSKPLPGSPVAAGGPTPATSAPSAAAALAKPSTPRRWPFVGFLSSTALSVTANAMVAVIVPYLVLTRTDSPAQAGLVGAVSLAASVPALLLGGPVIDRWGRRRVSVAADLLSALAVAALPVVDTVVGLTLMTTLALVAFGAFFDGPGAAARESARPELAAHTGFPLDAVNARGEAMDGLGQVVGPALAGAALGVVGAMTSLWGATAMFVVAALLTWRSLPRDTRHVEHHEPYVQAALTGLRLVWRDPPLRDVTLLGTVAMTFAAPFTLVLAAHFEPLGQPGGIGLVAGAFGAGAIVGALGFEPLARRVSRRALVVGPLVVVSLTFALMALQPAPGWFAALGALAGVAAGPINPVLVSIIQRRTPPELLGRVVSTNWSLSLLASPLGMLAAGVLLEATSVGVTMLALGAGILLTAGYAAAARGLGAADADLELSPPPFDV